MSSNDFILLNQFGFVLRLVSQRYARIFKEVLPGDVLPAEIAALAILQRAVCSEAELAAAINADAAMTAMTMARLLRDGLVEPVMVNDQPAFRVTEAGRVTGQKLVDAADLIIDTALAPLTRYERHVLMEMLKKLV